MTQNESPTPDPALTDDDLDVEGHGLKEVAAGLSTAALLATGAAGAAGVIGGTHGGPTHVQAGPASVTVQADTASVRDAAGGGLTQAAAVGQTAATAVGSTATAVGATAGNTTTSLTQTVKPVVSDPIGSTDKLVDRTVTQVRDARDGALAQGQTTVKQAQHDVDRAAAQGETGATAVRDSATSTEHAAVEQAATTMHATLSAAQAAADGGRTLVMSLTKVTAGGSVDAMNATGTVTVSDNGVVVGTATVKDGQASLTLTAPVAGSHTMTVTYHGDAAHAPSTTTV